MLKPRKEVPNIEVDLVNDTKWKLSEQEPENFTMVLFYRGKHCPICRKQLQELQNKLEDFVALGINVIAISSDTEEKAKATYKEWKVDDLPIGYGFSIEEARTWGMFISDGIKEEPKQFIEPGLFLIKPDGTLYSASIQSMPFARPSFDDILTGAEYIIKNGYPARGEA
ncbi:AhpC/TSA family protein [Maribacter sp.]|nr:AhpC/TSA family protein [Maribacter sp.]